MLSNLYRALTSITRTGDTPTSGTLTGQVRNTETDQPVGWVLLVVEELDRARSADAEGRFAFQDLPPGDYVLKTLRIGYREARFRFAIRAGATTRLALKLGHTPLETEALVVEGQTTRAISELREPEVVFSGKKLRQHLSRTILPMPLRPLQRVPPIIILAPPIRPLPQQPLVQRTGAQGRFRRRSFR